MNLKRALQNKQKWRTDEADVDITPVMNIFLILIPFLLLTAVFVKVAILDLSLPNLESRDSRSTINKKQPESVVLNFLFIRTDELELKSPKLSFPKLSKTESGYDWQQLQQQLQRTKQQYPESEDIIISPENEIKYQTIITVMDQCREAGFPNISISG
ncbi:hypothetical protein GF407_02115 [candidate division KSB1 bacterium]|nr:hypothetical protein [candidate division KSB1 bacterium]